MSRFATFQIFDPLDPESVLWDITLTPDRELLIELVGTGSVTLTRDLEIEGAT